jgi:epoxyqueuosine reductase
MLVNRAKDLGFACAGIATLESSKYKEQYERWIEQGMHGAMDWLERNNDKRLNPNQLVDQGLSVLMVADLYASRDKESSGKSEPTVLGHGKIARYARGRDYHKVMKKRLIVLADEIRAQYPDASLKVFVDTAPVPERELAQRAGIGWTGKNTLTINPKLGSYFFLGGIVMTLEVHAPQTQESISDHCGTCTRCIDACPTDAITPYQVDARRCISYLTIEHRDRIDPKLQSKMGDWIYGCDICQEVCPHNSLKETGIPAHVHYQSERGSFDLLEVLDWKEEDRRQAFTNSAMKRAKLDMIKRNAVIVTTNQLQSVSASAEPTSEESQELKGKLEELNSDLDTESIVRQAVSVGLGALNKDHD